MELQTTKTLPTKQMSRSLLASLILILAVHLKPVTSFSSSPLARSSSSIAAQYGRFSVHFTHLRNALFNDDDDDDEDEFIDTDSLEDWRTFRRNLTFEEITTTTTTTTTTKEEEKASTKTKPIKSVSTENEEILLQQNEKLAVEYLTGVWAHPIATPEVGGLIARMPLEGELFHNHKHSILGKRLHQLLDGEDQVQTWYSRAKTLIEDEMKTIAGSADDEGQIDATALDEVSSEMLSLFMDNQEYWQEVCLVVQHEKSISKSVVLNRPMSFKLTDNIARLVLHGTFSSSSSKNKESSNPDKELILRKKLVRFMTAFASECAVYVGGPDDQNSPALMIHGIQDLPGAVEISPGSKIYQGGIDAAVNGILEGEYSPLEFRFFLGCHMYKESALDVAVHLGKYQPIACARSLALKQCIALPKPLWHEVMELCGGELGYLSSLEMSSADDLQFQVVDETEYDGGASGPEGGLENLDDEDDDFYL